MKAAWCRVWALPVTLVGGLLGLVVLILGGTLQRVDGVVEAGGGVLGRWMRRSTRIEAITLGHVVIGVDLATLSRWRRHEHAHVRQYERWGALLPLLYLGSSLLARLRGRDAYLHNGFEREARVIARRGRVPRGVR